MIKQKRAFSVPKDALRCRADIKLRDNSDAQCMRAARVDGLCLQHNKIRLRKLVRFPGGL